MEEIKSYVEFVKANRENIKPDGFSFDVNAFENLIDCWTPFETIPVLLQTTHADLDRFCKIVYALDYRTAYNVLSGITDAFMRKTFKQLAAVGNNTAMNIVSEHFMGLKSDNKVNASVTIVNDLKED